MCSNVQLCMQYAWLRHVVMLLLSLIVLEISVFWVFLLDSFLFFPCLYPLLPFPLSTSFHSGYLSNVLIFSQNLILVPLISLFFLFSISLISAPNFIISFLLLILCVIFLVFFYTFKWELKKLILYFPSLLIDIQCEMLLLGLQLYITNFTVILFLFCSKYSLISVFISPLNHLEIYDLISTYLDISIRFSPLFLI